MRKIKLLLELDVSMFSGLSFASVAPLTAFDKITFDGNL